MLRVRCCCCCAPPSGAVFLYLMILYLTYTRTHTYSTAVCVQTIPVPPHAAYHKLNCPRCPPRPPPPARIGIIDIPDGLSSCLSVLLPLAPRSCRDRVLPLYCSYFVRIPYHPLLLSKVPTTDGTLAGGCLSPNQARSPYARKSKSPSSLLYHSSSWVRLLP
jgi:hypothetical protein